MRKKRLQLIKLVQCDVHRLFNQYADKGLESILRLNFKKMRVHCFVEMVLNLLASRSANQFHSLKNEKKRTVYPSFILKELKILIM